MHCEVPRFPGFDAIREIQKQLHNELDNAWTAWAIRESGLTPPGYELAVNRGYAIHLIDARTNNHVLSVPGDTPDTFRVVARGMATFLHDECTIQTVWRSRT